MRVALSGLLAIFLVCTSASAQGLLSLGQHFEIEGFKPWTASLSSQVGWDSNPGASSQDGNDDKGSAYLQNDVTLGYTLKNQTDQIDLTGNYSNQWYEDPGPGVQKSNNNWKIAANYTRKESRVLTIQDTFYIAHQTQPDFGVGLTLNRPTNGSLAFYNGLSVSCALSPVLSFISGYNLTDVRYDDEIFQTEDYLDNLFSEQLKLQMSRRTSGSFSLRYEITRYEHNPNADSHTYFALVGLDHQFSRYLQGSINVGAEMREYDGPLGNSASPYLEASLNYQASQYTNWRWYANIGQSAAGNSGQQNGLSCWTGLSYQRQLTALLSLNLAINYEWTTYSGGPTITPGDDTQQMVSASANLSYKLWRNVSLTAGYTFTDVVGSSALVTSYRRQQATLGLTASF